MEDKNDEDPNISIGNLPLTINRINAQRCKICGDIALHSNYGAITCSPCKMFFKRNAILGRSKFRCDLNNECEINIYNRHICPACRLEKCFANGMQIELIRCPISQRRRRTSERIASNQSLTTISNILTTINEQQNFVQFPTSNLLQSNSSTFDLNSLTNLISFYNEKPLVSLAEQFLVRTEIEESLAKEFFAKLYQTSGNYLRSNNDLCTLILDDRSRFLRNAAECVTWLGETLIWHQLRLNECQPFLESFTQIYGAETIDMIRHVLKFIDSDLIVAKLGISLFAFSNNQLIFNSDSSIKSMDIRPIVRIQNSYAQLIWNYLLNKYGFHQTIQRWINLIQCFLAATNAMDRAQIIDKHVHDINLLVEETELSLVLDDIESVDED